VAEPKREQAMVALAELLGALSGIRPGGWIYPSLPTVSRLAPPHQLPTEESAYPLIRVIAGRHSQLQPTGNGRAARAYLDRFHVDIWGITAPSHDGISETIADTWRNRLREDIVETLHLNPSLGGVAKLIDFAGGNDRREEVDHGGELGEKVFFVLPVTVVLQNDYATLN
jgi:hypothetical protein